MAAADSDAESRRLGKYQLQKKLGAGGMGTVYLALDTELGRTVALKVLPREKAENELLVKRFKAEAHAAAQLRHENIVTVYEAGQADGLLYIALEYVDGVDAQQLIDRRGPIPPRRTVEIIKQVAQALQHAYERNIVHRDIKPSNLLIDRQGVVKLTDLGLARSVDEATTTSITRAGTTVGTVDYMAPEQARDSKAADIRSDIYSLGCTWYHLLTGSCPFPEGSVTNKLNAHATRPPPDPRTVQPAIPEGVVATLHRMMAKAPEARYQTPRELLRDLATTHLIREEIPADALAALASESAPSAKTPAARSARPVRASVGARETPETADGAAPTAPTRPVAGHPNTPEVRPPRLPPADKADAARRRITREADEPDGTALSPLQNALVAVGAVILLGVIWFLATQIHRDAGDDSAFDAPYVREPYLPPDETGSPLPPEVSQPPPVAVDPPSQTPASVDPPPGSPPESQPVRPRPALPLPLGPVVETIGRAGEEIPGWAVELAALGPSAVSDRNTRPVAMLAGDAAGKAVSLEPLLRRLPDEGGVIRLEGGGPFVIPPSEIAVAGTVVLVAASQQRPLLVLQLPPGARSTAVLRIAGSTLALHGLDLVFAADSTTTRGDLALIEAGGGDVVLRDCTVTMTGRRAGGTSVLRAAAGPAGSDRPARALLEKCYFRGSALGAVDVAGAGIELTAANCLFAGGAAPLIRIQERGNNSSGAGRELRLFSCTAALRNAALEFTAPTGTSSVAPTKILVQNSLIGAGPSENATVLASLVRWPQQSPDGPGGVQIAIRSSLILGWSHLAVGTPEGLGFVQNVEGWRKFFQPDAQAEQFQFGSWPEEPLSDFEALEPQALDSSGEVVTGVQASDGGRPGCRVTGWHVPPRVFVARGSALGAADLLLPENAGFARPSPQPAPPRSPSTPPEARPRF